MGGGGLTEPEGSEPQEPKPEAAEAFDDPLLSSWVRELRERVRARAEQNQALEQVMVEGVDRLVEGDVPVILIGGAALRYDFESMAGRPLDRMRLMVPRSRMAEAGSILEGSGFGPLPRTGGQGGEGSPGATRPQSSYQKADVTLDLCWQPADEVTPGLVERCWDRSRIADDGSGLRLLTSAHRVACGAAEVAERDLSETLLRLGDLALQFPLSEPEEKELAKEARGWPSRIVHGPLWLLGQWGVPVPRSLTEPVRIRWWETGVTRRVLERVVVGDALAFLSHRRLVSAAHRWLARSGSMTAALLHSAERRVRRQSS